MSWLLLMFKKNGTVLVFRFQAIRMDCQQQEMVHTHTHTDSSRQIFIAMKTIGMGLKFSILEKQRFWRKSVRQALNTALIKERTCWCSEEEQSQIQSSYLPAVCFWYIVFMFLVFQKMTRWKNCRNCRGRNGAKYAWTKILALSSSHVGTWLLVNSVQNHSSSVQSAAKA